MSDSILDHCSNLHRFVRGVGAPDTLFSKDTGGIDIDPNRFLEANLKEWSSIWGCDDPSKRAAVACCTKVACTEARLVADEVAPLHGLT